MVDEVNSNITLIDKLQRFEYKDKNLKDWGLNVRQRAKALVTLVSDADKIRKERQKVAFSVFLFPYYYWMSALVSNINETCNCK